MTVSLSDQLTRCSRLCRSIFAVRRYELSLTMILSHDYQSGRSHEIAQRMRKVIAYLASPARSRRKIIVGISFENIAWSYEVRLK